MSPLTPRETEVATLAARGMSNKQISVYLGISWRTVKVHMHSALRKSGLPNRAALAAVIARAA